MRKFLFRGKTNKGEWVQGDLLHDGIDYDVAIVKTGSKFVTKVIFETVGQHTGLNDKNGTKVFEGDIVQYINSDDFDCQSIVKFGEYKQDGSGGEYGARKCLGFYVDVDNFTCPDWCEDDPEYFPRHMWQQNILEVVGTCEVIGNIHDNPELLTNDEVE